MTDRCPRCGGYLLVLWDYESRSRHRSCVNCGRDPDVVPGPFVPAPRVLAKGGIRKTCRRCGREYMADRDRQRYCSPGCAYEARKET